MKDIKGINKKADRIIKGKLPDVFAYSPIPKPDCSSNFQPGIEIHSAASSTDMNASTRGLCSPFYRDTMICGCSYWPAHDPDVKVEQTNEFWAYEPGLGHGAGHSQNVQELRFVYQKEWQGQNPGREGADAWDRKSPDDITDIFIRDNAQDNGQEPSGGVWWESPDIFVRNQDDLPGNFIAPGPSDHQNPIAGQKNFLYARIRNISKRKQNGVEVGHMIDNIFVKFYAHGCTTNPTSWELVGHTMVRDVPPGPVVVKSVKPWIPQTGGHVCAMVIIDSTQDPVKLLNTGPNFSGYDEKVGPQPDSVSVPDDNNVAQRNMTSVLAVAGWAPIKLPFDIRPIVRPIPWLRLIPHETIAEYTIEVERPKLPREASVSLELPGALMERVGRLSAGFPMRGGTVRSPLRPREIVKASLAITLPPSIKSGQEYRILVKQSLKRKLLGGITISVRTADPILVRFVGNTETREVHSSFCPRVREMRDSNKRAFFNLNDARSWGYEPHRECTAGLA